MDERKILSAVLHDRSAFSTVEKFLKPKDDLSDRGLILWNALAEWYHADELCNSIDKEVFVERLGLKYPTHADLFKQSVLGMEPVSIPNIVQAFIDFKLESLSHRLTHALACRDKNASDALMQEYQTLRDTREEALQSDRRVLIGAKAEYLGKSLQPENLIRLYPSNLNESVEGGVPRGSHILIFGPVEVGKTLTSVNMAAGMAHDGRKVLYCANEEAAELTLMRFKSRLSKRTRAQILADPEAADRQASQNGFDNLIFVSLAPGTVRDLYGLVDEHRPDVLFVDQLHNVARPGTLSKVDGLEWLATQMRNLAKSKNIVVVSSTQGADSAIGKLYLDMGDVYYSNVAIQSQVDLMIGIGMDRQAQEMKTRVLNLCKNKLTGMHAPVYVKIEPQLSQMLPDDSLRTA